MIILISLLIATLLIALVYYRDKEIKLKRSSWSYFLFFVLFFSLYVLMFNSQFSNSIEVVKSFPKNAITPYKARKSADYYDKMIDKYKIAGQKAFREAEKICRWLPDEEDQEAAYTLFRQAMECSAGLAFGGWKGLVATLAMALTDYGIFVSK